MVPLHTYFTFLLVCYCVFLLLKSLLTSYIIDRRHIMITHRNFRSISAESEMDKYFIGLTLNFYPDWEYIAQCMQSEGYHVTISQCENRWKRLSLLPPATMIPSDEDDAFDSTKGDFDYYANIRKGLGLHFTISTKRSIFLRDCGNKDSSCKVENCLIHNSGLYNLCPHAIFACARCGKPLGAGDFDIDHIKSFKKHWDSLNTVNIEQLKLWYNSIDNLQILCVHCNRSLGAK